MTEEKNNILIVGHKNPDTDSICSAIAYADLKNKIGEGHYEARRAGKISDETQFVLNYFGVEAPELLEDIRPQVKDIDYRKTKGVSRTISLKKAWALMKELNVVTLPITRNKRLEGLITIGDIANTYMEVYDSTILSAAHTRYSNIVETLEGSIVVGDEKEYFCKGKVLVAAANPDLMEDYIEEHDLVIVGNRYESQLCAIEMNAGCLVVCEGAKVSLTIRKLAEEHKCTIISTPYDAFTAARQINQSMPISYFMRRDNLVTFIIEDFVDDIRDTMAKLRHRDFPVLDAQGCYLGMASRRNLLGLKKKKVILVDHNEKAQAVNGIEDAEILEIIDHHRLGTIETMGPVFFRNQPLGCTGTIIYQMYIENNLQPDKTIAGLLCSAIISDTLLFRSPTCTGMDRMAALQLAQIAGIDPEVYSREMFSAGSKLGQKEPSEILYQDFKEFTIGEKELGIGQVMIMNESEMDELQEKLTPFAESERKSSGLDMLFVMMTSILGEYSRMICCGQGAQELVERSFGQQTQNNTLILPSVVSRKKQLVPALTMGMQQE
ncbi:MAG: putative manganese-dependent inorganic diphosphatase [Lachnospiraceae bacterium]